MSNQSAWLVRPSGASPMASAGGGLVRASSTEKQAPGHNGIMGENYANSNRIHSN